MSSNEENKSKTKPKVRKVTRDVPGFNTYIGRVFDLDHENYSLTSSATSQLNQILIYLIDSYRRMGINLILNRLQATITNRQIETFTRTLFFNFVERWDQEVDYDLVQGLVNYGKDAVRLFHSTDKGKFEDRTGLKIPYSRVTKIFTQEAYYDKFSYRIGSGSMVMLAGVMEKLLRIIFESSVKVMEKDSRKQLKPRDIFLAYHQNPTLTRALEGELRVRMTQVGMVPFLSSKLVPVTEEQKKKMEERKKKLAKARKDRREREKEKEKEKESKKKNTLPGKKALREIKEHQKSTHPLLTPTNMKNLIRKMAEYNLSSEEEGPPKIILGRDPVNLIHYVVEDKLGELFRDAMMMDDKSIISSEHLRRVRVITQDLLLRTKAGTDYLIPGKHEFEEREKMSENQLKESGTVEDYILSITSNSITRVARRAGVASLNKKALVEARTVIYHLTNTLVNMALESRVDRNATKIQLRDVEYALKTLNFNYTYSPPRKSKKKKPSSEEKPSKQ